MKTAQTKLRPRRFQGSGTGVPPVRIARFYGARLALAATASILFLETPLNGLPPECGPSMLRSMISEWGRAAGARFFGVLTCG